MRGVWREGTKMEKKNVMVELKEKAETYRFCDKTLATSNVIFCLFIVFSMIVAVCLRYGPYKHFFWVGTALMSVFALLAILVGRSRKQNKREFDEWCNQKKLDLFFEYSIAQSRFPCANEPGLNGAMLEEALTKLECAQNTFHTFARAVDGLRADPKMEIPDSVEPAKSETP